MRGCSSVGVHGDGAGEQTDAFGQGEQGTGTGNGVRISGRSCYPGEGEGWCGMVSLAQPAPRIKYLNIWQLFVSNTFQ